MLEHHHQLNVLRTSGGDETKEELKDIEYTPFNSDGSPDTAVAASVGDVVLDDNFKDYKFSVSSLKEFTLLKLKLYLEALSLMYYKNKRFRGIALAV